MTCIVAAQTAVHLNRPTDIDDLIDDEIRAMFRAGEALEFADDEARAEVSLILSKLLFTSDGDKCRALTSDIYQALEQSGSVREEAKRRVIYSR